MRSGSAQHILRHQETKIPLNEILENKDDVVNQFESGYFARIVDIAMSLSGSEAWEIVNSMTISGHGPFRGTDRQACSSKMASANSWFLT